MRRLPLASLRGLASRSSCCSAVARRQLAAVVPPPPPGADVEKMPGDGGAGGSLSRADPRDMEEQAAAAEEAPIEVGPPITAHVEHLEHDADDPLVAPSEIKQVGTATTVPKGQKHTMAAPELQGGG